MGGTSYGTFTTGGGGGGGGSATFYQEQPSGTVNGANVTFTLAHTPTAGVNVVLWLDGVVQYQGTDYTILGAVITMTAAPTSPQTLWAFYS